MLCTVMFGPGDVQVVERPVPGIVNQQDCVVRVFNAGICGSDLWAYRGIASHVPGQPVGHEFVGEVVAVGDEVQQVAVGDEVAAPFSWNCGSCHYCEVGLTTSCERGGVFGRTAGSSGGQSEYVRVPHADNTLVRLAPGTLRSTLATAVLLCGDVLATGLHANRMASTGPGDRCVVVGDGSVGMAATLMARRAGAAHVTMVGRHGDRLAAVRGTDRTALADEYGQIAGASAMKADVVLDCVGTAISIAAAVSLADDGGRVAVVGVPHGVSELPVSDIFKRNISINFGLTPARTYMCELLRLVLDGDLDVSWLVDTEMPVSEASEGYRRMASRSALKVVLHARPF